MLWKFFYFNFCESRHDSNHEKKILITTVLFLLWNCWIFVDSQLIYLFLDCAEISYHHRAFLGQKSLEFEQTLPKGKYMIKSYLPLIFLFCSLFSMGRMSALQIRIKYSKVDSIQKVFSSFLEKNDRNFNCK